MTLELLKGVANLTCSENLVIQNCPQQLGVEIRLAGWVYGASRCDMTHDNGNIW